MTHFVEQQGEVSVEAIDAIPDGLTPVKIEADGHIIVSESESHHHHVLLEKDVVVFEKTKDVPAGLRVLYAIVKNPTALIQTAPDAHEEMKILPGMYEIIVGREFNPFLDEARRIAD